MTPDFWRGRRVLLTGHTGFKGAWLALWLESLGAKVTAVALPPETEPNLFEVLAPWPDVISMLGDLRDPQVARQAMREADPEIVFHLAAQALVRPSYRDPGGTFATNVLGTTNLLDALRQSANVEAALVVTSDKVYQNDGSGRPLSEDDRLGGADPYSASKSCQDLVTTAYRESFFRNGAVRLASARAGNVIGGGDWAEDRLIPDFMRAVGAGREVPIRHPDSTRPWQHVLEPLAGYLAYAERLHAAAEAPPALNFGPCLDDVRPVRWVVDRVAKLWGGGASWRQDKAETVPEAQLLTLDADLAIRSLGWRPRLGLDQALEWTVAWYRAHRAGDDMRAFSLDQIQHYQDPGR